MNDISNNVLGSNVVKTVKNMKRKLYLNDDLKLTKAFSVNDDKTGTKTTSATEVPEEENKEDINQPRSKRIKDDMGLGPKKEENIMAKSTTSNFGKSTRTDVFSRLATRKSMTIGHKKKVEKKEIALNFFDKQYKIVIKGFIEGMLTKDKKINEFLDEKGISRGFVVKRIVQSSHFMICKGSLINLLNQMYKDGEVDAELRNINPTHYVKLLNFFLEKIEFENNLDRLDEDMKSIHSKNITRLANSRLSSLKDRLSQVQSSA